MSVTSRIPAEARHEFWQGFKDTLPLVVGAIPFGIIFGALAVTAGVSPAGAMGLSLFVFAGSSQFIATSLIASGAGAGIIILTTFIVNFRHALYSTTLGPHMRELPQRWLLPLGFWLTDESFVVTANRYNQPDDSPFKHWYFLGSAVFMYTNWQLCTAIGIAAGQAVPDPAGWGLDFAMVVTFIGLIVPAITTRPILVAVLAAGAGAMLAYNMPNRLGLLTASLVGITAGLAAELIWREKPEEKA